MSELRAEQDEARAVGGTSEHKKVDVELNEMTSAWQLMQEKAMKLKCQLEREKQSLAAEKAHLDTEKKVHTTPAIPLHAHLLLLGYILSLLDETRLLFFFLFFSSLHQQRVEKLYTKAWRATFPPLTLTLHRLWLCR
jgi:hypothetical protein